MKSETTKKMRAGFICRSPADTAVCMTGDPRSVVVPRRPDRTMLVDQKRLVNVAKYSRLQAESGRSTLLPSPVLERRASVIVRPSIKKGQNQEQGEPTVRFHKPSSLTPTDNVFQVVVMRVSLHCQGCAGKVKKHLSKMEGVTSFSIDLETKRVTVMGHVSPALVLESVSKVKKAEFWPC